MKSLFKISKLKLAGLIATATFLTAGTVFAYNIATPSKTVNNSTKTEQTSAPKKTANDSEQVDTTPTADKTASDSTANASTQTTAEAPKTTTTQPTQTATNTAPQQTATNPTPTPTCNESMKSSYTSLYNSQVASENASWNNQITAWNNYAAAHGMSFSGYTQSQIDANKPAHDAKLAQYQTQYYQNLASINCNP